MNKKSNLDSPVALITGCGSGIARHLTTVVLNLGYRVLATDINMEALEKSAMELKWPSNRILLQKLDVRSAGEWEQAIKRVVETWGQLDVCMNIAGFCVQGFSYEIPLEQIDLHLDINTKGAIIGTRLAAEQMLKQGFGHIINMCSLAALAPVPGTSLYCASKFALRGFSIAAYYELNPKGIDVSIVEPDLVNTAKLETQLKYGDTAAAVGFSAPKILELKDIEKAFVDKVLKKRNLEVAIPPSRGWLCKIGNLFPGLSGALYRKMTTSGLKNIEREKAKRKHLDKIVTPDQWIMEKDSNDRK